MKNPLIFIWLLSIFTFQSCQDKPEANFEVSSNNVEINRSVKMTNKSLNATKYSWDFGNNLSSASTNPETSYEVAGVYVITLEVFDEKEKNSDVFSESIQVQNPNEKFKGQYQGDLKIDEDKMSAQVAVTNDANSPYRLSFSIATENINFNANIEENTTSAFRVLNNTPSQSMYAGTGEINENKLSFTAFLMHNGATVNLSFNGSKI